MRVVCDEVVREHMIDEKGGRSRGSHSKSFTSRSLGEVVRAMCSSSEAGSYSRLIDFVYHSTLSLRVIKKRRRMCKVQGAGCEV